MCGIAGIVDFNNKVNREFLIKMREALIHRGPDETGLWIDKTEHIGFTHTRLSIIDLTFQGHQPMWDIKEQCVIVFNGEIYNYRKLRLDLEKRGYLFKGNSDTEVILNSYLMWGEECLKLFNGMFAFALWDEREKVLFLARDRAGQKPLYYFLEDNRIIFASEIKALLNSPFLKKEIDLEALNFYFAYGYIPYNKSIFKKVRKLLAGTYMVFNKLESTIKTYYKILPQEKYLKNYKFEDYENKLEEILLDSVKLRLVSDVPVGAFLSGGLDSSLIVALMRNFIKGKLQTFSIGFTDKRCNELPYARKIAEYFETEHYEFILQPDNKKTLELIVSIFDEPFADSSFIPTYYLSRFTKQKVKVALSGDAGDELFAGYNIYQASLWFNKFKESLPYFLRKLFYHAGELLVEDFKGERFLKRFLLSSLMDFIERRLYFRDFQRKLLFNPEVLSHLKGNLLSPELYRLESMSKNNLNSLTYSDFKIFLCDDILVKVDRASMACGLEVRSPFLDYRLIEFVFKELPDEMRLKKNCKKYILKKVARKYLPVDFDFKRKQGFVIPIHKWMKGPWRGVLIELINEYETPLLNSEYVNRLIKENDRNFVDHSAQLFLIMVYLLWRKRYFER